jgi:methionyl-tRNA formyltransferase
MRVVLMANESIGYECLKTLLEAKQDVVAVVTDSKFAKTIWQNVKIMRLASEANIRHLQTGNINAPEFLDALHELAPDIIFNIAFVQIYKTPILSMPKSGCINFHPGPLPRYGGSIGWVWAIINGETEYGVAFHYMKEKIDAGDIIGIAKFPIDKNETGLSLLTKCYVQGATLFRSVLSAIVQDKVVPVPQNMQERTYYYNKVPYEGMIDVGWSVTAIERFVRALSYSPMPNPLSPPMVRYGQQRLIIAKARTLDGSVGGDFKPGEVVDVHDDKLVMQAGDGAVELTLANHAKHVSSSGVVTGDSTRIMPGMVLGA